MSYRFSMLASVCAAALILPGLPNRAAAESLNDAVASALAGSPSIEAAQAGRDALGQDAREKQSDYFPQLSLEAIGGRIYGDNATSRGLSVTRGAGYSGYGEGSVTLTQPIFNGFQTNDRVHAATARRDSADYGVANTREELALRTALAYLDVARGQESIRRIKAYGKTLDSYVARIRKMVKEGGADASLGQQADDIRRQLENTLVSSEGQLQSAIATYNELTGHLPDGRLEKPVPPMDIIPDDVADAKSYARDHHPSLKAAALNEKAADMDRKAEQASYFPTLNGQLSYLKSDEKDLLGGELVDARAVLKMDWNYAVGGAEQARVRKTIYQREQSRAQHEDLDRQIARRIEVAYSDNRTAEQESNIQRQRVKLNEGLFTTQKQQFEGGKVNLLQLEQTDNSLFNARVALMNDEYKALAAKYTILASMGRLQEAMAEAPVASPPHEIKGDVVKTQIVRSPRSHVRKGSSNPAETVSPRSDTFAPALEPLKASEATPPSPAPAELQPPTPAPKTVAPIAGSPPPLQPSEKVPSQEVAVPSSGPATVPNAETLLAHPGDAPADKQNGN